MNKSVYIETSVVSYFVADQSSDIRIAGHQLATKECWAAFENYTVYISDTVVEEASRGNEIQSQRRLSAIKSYWCYSHLELQAYKQSIYVEKNKPGCY